MSTRETIGFQAEVRDLLHLVIHSLYSNDEIFLRELISNSSDAAEKLKYLALTQSELYENDADLKIHIDINKEAKTITIRDNGIGMSRQDVIDHLGTIAKSGTREFIAALSQNKDKDARMIGQFGVGFYSAFIVADKVVVETRKAGLSAAEAVRWESTGEGDYAIETITKTDRGTAITLHLREGKEEFLDDWRIRNIIHKYSEYIPFEIIMKKENPEPKEGEPVVEYEKVNRALAIWTLSKSEIKEEQYQEFYKNISHDFEDALAYSHNKVEGKQEYTTLLYIPKRAPFDLWYREHTRGLKLYVQRVFIMDNAEHFLPNYLRFVKGIVDSNDLPLNISREILQNNKIVENIKSSVVKRVLSMLQKMAGDEPENYKTFWNEFGQVLKEGIAEDFSNKEEIAKLLRFATTHNDSNEPNVSFDQYIERMKPDQDKIYYITSENINTARFSPHMEIFKKKGIEVLLLTDRIDEWVVSHLSEYKDKKLQSVAKGSVDLDKLEDDEATKKEQEKLEEEFKDLLTRVKEALTDKVKEVRASHRLTDSPACVVVEDQEMNMHMQHILKAAGQNIPMSKPILELNLKHPLVEKLDRLENDNFKQMAEVLLEQSLLIEGVALEDPVKFVQRVNTLLSA